MNYVSGSIEKLECGCHPKVNTPHPRCVLERNGIHSVRRRVQDGYVHMYIYDIRAKHMLNRNTYTDMYVRVQTESTYVSIYRHTEYIYVHMYVYNM